MSEGRGQFTFYRSFWEAAKLIDKPADRLCFLEAICAFALDEEEREITKAIAPSFLLVKPTLLSSAKKAKSGKTGGSRKQSASKAEANEKQNQADRKQSAREKEGEIEKENEKENEVEYECIKPEPVLADVMNFYLDRINPTPSPICIDEIKCYVNRLSAAVVLHAFQIALDERKAAWSYIRAILQRYSAQGLKTMEAVLMAEQEYAGRKSASDTGGAGRYSVILEAELDDR